MEEVIFEMGSEVYILHSMCLCIYKVIINNTYNPL